jgi:hypothetical protein
MAVEAECGDLGHGAPPQLGVGAALRNAEDELAVGAGSRELPLRPARRAEGSHLELGAIGVRRKADVEAHGNVRPQPSLDLRDELRGEARRFAVVDGAEGDALVVGTENRVAERKDLEAAGVGQDRPVPAREPVKASQVGDDLRAGPEMQVVGVREEDRRPELE